MKENGNRAAKSSRQGFWHKEHANRIALQNHPAKASDMQLGCETNEKDWKRNKIQRMGDKLKTMSRGLQHNPSEANTDTEQGWETHGKAIQQSLFTDTWKKMQIELQTHPAKDIKKDKMVLRVLFWSFGRQDQSLDRAKDLIQVRYREHINFWQWPHEVQGWKAQVCRSREQIKHQCL